MIFDLDEKDLEIISAALSRLAYFQVAELIEKIKIQIQNQTVLSE